jgi:hypothetical protein
MKKLFSLVTIVLFLHSCANKNNEQINLMTLITQSIEGIKDNKNQLCLFIADNMCTECITTEYRNIKSNNVSVSLVGIFKNKRHFMSSTSQIGANNRIFIERKQKYNNIPNQLFYFIYNTEKKTCSEIFYPAPCETEKTLSYFQKIKNAINN